MKIFEDNTRQRVACILAMGTSTPPNCVLQCAYPDQYFHLTHSHHNTPLKDKFHRLCNKTMIKKRYMHLTQEILESNPEICSYTAPSLDARQDIAIAAVPNLGKEAAEKAIKEWGQPKSGITHLVFCTSSCISMPGADFHLAALLGLDPSVKRCMIYQQGCFAGGTALRVAKDLAENNPNSRVLIVCSEINALMFRGPSDQHLDSLVGPALMGDGAAAVVVGSDPVLGAEHPLFQLISATQTIVPDSESDIYGDLREVGLMYHLSRNVPELISNNICEIVKGAFNHIPMYVPDWNSLFWAVHPGGAAILDRIENKLRLKVERLGATRHVLREYGNMSSSSVLFVLDEMRKFSRKEGLSTTGEGSDWGVLVSYGPGVTVETVILRGVPIHKDML